MNPHPPEEVHLPAPSIWPAVLGAAITLLAFGVVTHVAFSLAGVALLALALAGWIGDLRHG